MPGKSRWWTKRLANFITALRIPASLALLFLPEHQAAFYIVYFACGLSDVLDGAVARRMGSAGAAGAALDSAADTVLTGVLLALYLPRFSSVAVIWTIAVAGIKLASLAVGWTRFHAYAALHTVLNKLTGLLLFCLPLLTVTLGMKVSAGVLLGAASLAALEELLANLTASRLNPDMRGIF